MLKSFFEHRNPELKTDIISIDGNMLEEARKETVRPSKQFDYEDIDFLKQFPIEYYGQALHQRYNMLFNVLQRIHEMQQNLGFPELKHYLKIFLMSKDRLDNEDAHTAIYHLTEGDVDDGFRLTTAEIVALNNEYSPEKLEADNMSDDDYDNLADEEANKFWWKKLSQENFKQIGPELVDIMNNNAVAEFKFKGSYTIYHANGDIEEVGGGKSKKTIKAKPYLNRLYHMLERNRNEAHIAGSGLENGSDFIESVKRKDPQAAKALTLGKYGLELRNPKESKSEYIGHAFRKTQFPSEEQTSRAPKNYLMMLAHRVLGKLDDPGIIWQPTSYVDSFERERLLTAETKRLMKVLKTQHSDRQTLYAAAVRKANENIKERFLNRDPEIMSRMTSPPYPPRYEQGIAPFEHDGAKIENGTLVGPKLYLPFKKEGDKLVPVLLESHFYKEIGDKETVLPSHIVGHHRNFRKIDPLSVDPTGTDIQKEGGLFFNHNTPQQLAMVKGTNEYRKAFAAIFSSQKKARLDTQKEGDSISVKALPDDNGEYILPILQGVIICVYDKSCGKKTKFEINLMLQNIDLIYKFAYQYIHDDMGDDIFYKSESSDEYKTGHFMTMAIKNRAHLATKLLSQRAWDDLGGGVAVRAFGSAGRQQRLVTPLMQKRIMVPSINQEDGKPLPPVHFPYLPANVQEFIRDLEESEQWVKEINQKRNDAITTRFSTMVAKEKIEGIFKDIYTADHLGREDLRFLLAIAYKWENRDEKYTEEEAIENAERQLRSWEEQGIDLAGMFEKMKELDVVKKIKDRGPTLYGGMRRSDMNVLQPLTTAGSKKFTQLPIPNTWRIAFNTKLYSSNEVAEGAFNIVFDSNFIKNPNILILTNVDYKVETNKDKFDTEDLENIQEMIKLIYEKIRINEEYPLSSPQHQENMEAILKKIEALRSKYSAERR